MRRSSHCCDCETWSPSRCDTVQFGRSLCTFKRCLCPSSWIISLQRAASEVLSKRAEPHGAPHRLLALGVGLHSPRTRLCYGSSALQLSPEIFKISTEEQEMRFAPFHNKLQAVRNSHFTANSKPVYTSWGRNDLTLCWFKNVSWSLLQTITDSSTCWSSINRFAAGKNL